MNLKLNLKFNPVAILSGLKTAQPYLIGIALIGVFAYTAYVVNNALNAPPAPVANTALGISFDKATLDSLKNLNDVPSQISTPTLGKADPFGSN